MNQQFTFISLASNGLPPIIARKKVAYYFGGAISSKTLANADSLGVGPKGRLKIGREIAYPTPALLEWLDNRTKFQVI